MLGHQAGQQSSGTNYGTMIGYRAGFEATGCHYSVMVGWNAGHSASGSQNSIYLGYSAGKDRYGDDNLIINPSNSATLGGWAASDTDGIIDFADVIHGKHTSSTNKTLSIGKTPTSDADLSNITLGVRPASSAHTVLKTYKESAQAGDQIQSSIDSVGWANTIVNQYGWLELPTALRIDNTGALAQAYTHASSTDQKYKIDKAEGTVALYNPTGGSTKHLIVSDGSYWYKTANLTQM